MNFHSEDLQSVLAEVDTNVEKGLTKEEVKKRTEKFGSNKLQEKKKTSWAAKFFEQFKDVMIVILIIAALVGGALIYIRKEKKRGATCIGCPHAGECAKKRQGGCNSHTGTN